MTNGHVVEMELIRIIIDETRLEQVVVLREKSGERTLPIVIGTNEATAIKMEISGIHPPRPLTHDLLRSTIESLGATVDRIVIDSLKANTFFAKLYLKNSTEKPLIVDARPSDSIALAVRTRAPIFVSEDVLEKIGKIDSES